MYRLSAFNNKKECIEVKHFMIEPTSKEVQQFRNKVSLQHMAMVFVTVSRIEKKYSEVA